MLSLDEIRGLYRLLMDRDDPPEEVLMDYAAKYPSLAEAREALLSSAEFRDQRMLPLGRHRVPQDWPLKGEGAGTFRQKLQNGFFAKYMAGDIILDIGYSGGRDDAVPIVPYAIGIDLNYPNYDGVNLPFPDYSVDTVYASHILEHVADYVPVIREWYRVLKNGGFIICSVPHQHFSEKKSKPPSLWNPEHQRFYTPASLLREFEEALQPNTYRIRHLADNDQNYSYHIGPEEHAKGSYEIELVAQKREKPVWDLESSDGPTDRPRKPTELRWRWRRMAG
jgi:SAM-dependent methyltransferase